ncbi:hypothetical protein Q3G72_031702 [Acer saccharum]|nr:hypothetical protein Q3G72_031702 [Acer saccharum]
MSKSSNSKEAHVYPTRSGFGSKKSSPLTPHMMKRKDHPLSNDEGGSLQLQLSGRHLKVGSGFTNTVDSSFFVSREDESGTGVEDDGAGTKGVSVAIEVMLVMPEGFRCIHDSTTTEDTINKLCRNYGTSREVILLFPAKGYDAYTLDILEESRKIFQKIKDRKYDPLDRAGDPFNQHRVVLVLKVSAPSPGYQASDLLALDTSLLTPFRPLKLLEVMKTK